MPTQRRNALHSSNPPEWRPKISTRRASCLSGEWNDDDFDVLANGAVVGQTFKADPFRLLLGGDDRPPGALDNGHDLGPFGRRNCELVERLRHVIHERVPLARRDTQVPV